MTQLFTPIQLNQLELKNRIVMAPMCQYSVTAEDGKPNDWHFVHYTTRAIGGVGLVLVEMTDVHPDGRISNNDLGLWSDDQIAAHSRIVESVRANGAHIGIQLAHAGRKAQDAETPVAPSAIRFEGEHFKTPRALSADEVKEMVENFRRAAKRAVHAGYEMIELHGAHGYLIHQFQSPLTNQRSDAYGKDLSLFGSEVIAAVKSEMPSGMPLCLRITAVEYASGGYDIPYILDIAKSYHKRGLDAFHVSSGGEGVPGARRPGNYPGYQVPFARAFKETFDVPVIAVGMLEDAALAESVVANGDADMVAIARGLLRDPYWPIHAAKILRHEAEVPRQYQRAY